MVRAVLRGEGTLRGRIGRGLTIGLELNAIPLHISLRAGLILLAHSGENRKAGSEQLHTPWTGRFWPELLIAG